MTFAEAYNAALSVVRGGWSSGLDVNVIDGVQSNIDVDSLVKSYNASFAAHAWSVLVELPGAAGRDSNQTASVLRTSIKVWLYENPQMARTEGDPTQTLDTLQALATAFLAKPSGKLGKNTFAPSENFMDFMGAEQGVQLYRLQFSINTHLLI